MVIYKSLEFVLAEVESLDKFGTLYVNREEWGRAPSNTEIYLLAGDDELEDLDVDGNPMLANEYEVQYFFDVEIFQSVIELQKDNKPESVVDDYIYAINYYLGNDDFYEPS
ncbi:DUF7716 domain-containing protein [Pseudomonas viridiflava]|uniref:DUF7716 domain-containing protein n=1 Tax=Pseudomonas viridiflava TaxID=33069 RepID=UPI000F019845|nr:hypothetical protein [Pseudomonas viridiflava]